MQQVVLLFLAVTFQQLHGHSIEGHGPAWANSLFEDNAEFGLGIKLATDKKHDMALRLTKELREEIGSELVDSIIANAETTEGEIIQQRKNVNELKKRLWEIKTEKAYRLYQIAEFLEKKSMWIVGGDGWAYDIGFSGLDHVLSTGENVNILVMDTEVYSNTGGQKSKASPIGASAKFSIKGKTTGKRSRYAGHCTWHRLRCTNCHGCQRCACVKNNTRSRSISRAFHHHRVQPLHRPWIRYIATGWSNKALRLKPVIGLCSATIR